MNTIEQQNCETILRLQAEVTSLRRILDKVVSELDIRTRDRDATVKERDTARRHMSGANRHLAEAHAELDKLGVKFKSAELDRDVALESLKRAREERDVLRVHRNRLAREAVERCATTPSRLNAHNVGLNPPNIGPHATVEARLNRIERILPPNIGARVTKIERILSNML